ncbi:MAG TPA: NAD(P)/FAD-dependent oxidoreductase [Candidatus Binatia bacterium]|nr:NAD(P)/FAD-dependent oxidoreductase [Candidatus Binatia bacterium]
MSQSRPPRRIVIVGAGFGGLAMAIRLKMAGVDSFTILEKADRLGGTWRDNTYPGAACDSPSFLYCFSFAPKTDWSRKWAPQPEILAYMEATARRHDVFRHIRFDTEIASARFDADAGVWRVRTTKGETIEAEVLVSAVGQLNRPAMPEIPGLDRFAGVAFHSARWRHDAELAGKDVAVIGNAASAIQFIPQIAPAVQRLRIFQRSANWMIAKNDRPYGEREKRVLTRFSLLARLYRWWLWLTYEIRFPVFRQNRVMSRAIGRKAERDMRARVADPALQDVLVPDYPIGGKRILISDDYYEALGRPNVEVVTTPIERVAARGVVTRDGREHPADVVILATGFQSTSFLVPMRIEGPDGRSLADAWSAGAEAYLGITVAGFPNFFMLYGPNTNLGHNSIIFMIECQVRYVLDCLQALDARDLAWIDLRPEVMRDYNERLRRELAGSVWARTGKSWYKQADGRITNNWSGTTAAYWWRTRRADLSLYRQQACGAVAGAAVARVA